MTSVTISPSKVRPKAEDLDLTVPDRELLAILAANRGWQIFNHSAEELIVAKDRWNLVLSFRDGNLFSLTARRGVSGKPVERYARVHGGRCFRTAIVILGGFA